MINYWLMKIVMKYLFLKAMRIIGDPNDCSSDSWSSTLTHFEGPNPKDVGIQSWPHL